MTGPPEKITDKPEITLREVVHRFRYWMAMHNIPGADKVSIEFHFPDHSAQARAMVCLMREMDQLTLLSQPVPELKSPYGSSRFQIEGVNVTFTNPDRLDARRQVIWRDDTN